MKLYVSSYRIPTPDDLAALLGKKPADVKMVLIPNAKDYYAERARAVKIRDVKDYFKDLGYNPDVLDLRNYSSAEKLSQALKNYDFIWVTGGNTFIVRYEMHKSGFDKIINDMLDDGVIYGGDSAGACVAGNSLKGIELADDPEFSEGVIWDGLKILDNYILPHVGSTMFGDAIEQAQEMHKNNKTLIELTDTQALIINGNDRTIVDSAAA